MEVAIVARDPRDNSYKCVDITHLSVQRGDRNFKTGHEAKYEEPEKEMPPGKCQEYLCETVQEVTE